MRRHISLAAAALCLAAVSAAPAQAQLLKRIKQAAAEKIADKAVDKAADKAGVSSAAAPADAPAAASGASTGASTGASPGVNRGSQGVYNKTPAQGSSKVDITNERITQFIEAMGPVIAAGRELRTEQHPDGLRRHYHEPRARAHPRDDGRAVRPHARADRALPRRAAEA